MPRLNKVAVLILLGGLVSDAVAGTSHEELTESQVKAAFLLNFARFVEWPAAGNGAHAPLVIGIFGKIPLGAALDQLVNGKSVNGRSLVVRSISDAVRLQACSLVFIPASNTRRFD